MEQPKLERAGEAYVDHIKPDKIAPSAPTAGDGIPMPYKHIARSL